MKIDEIIALKEEAKANYDALERVERLLAAKNGIVPKKAEDDLQMPLVVQQPAGNAEIDEYDTEAPSDSLRGTIERIVNGEPNARWTTQKVLARLQELKYDLRAVKPIYSVGQSLNVLAKKGRIRLARKGAGSAPNIYKGKTQEVLAESRPRTGGNELSLTN
jgi:hypothetical protein